MPVVTASVTAMTGGVSVYATNLWDGTPQTLPNATNPYVCNKMYVSGALILDPSKLMPTCVNNSVR